MQNSYDYIFFGIIWLLLIFIVSIRLERIIKLIIWNYIISTMSLSIWNWVNILLWYLAKNPEFVLNKVEWIQDYLLKLKPYIGLVLFFVIIILMLTKSKIWYSVENKWLRVLLVILLAPLAVFSLIVSLLVTVIWNKLFDYDYMTQLANTYQANPWLYKFIAFFPLWIIIPWIVLILVSLDIKMPDLKFKKKEW